MENLMRNRTVVLVLAFWVFQFTGLETRQAYGATLSQAPVAVKNEKIDPNTWDFGQVKEGELLKHEFVFKNETSDILEIINIHTSCGCTASEAGKKSLMPQESTAISVVLKTKGYVGSVKQFVYVHTDSVDLSIVKFTVKANVAKGE